MKSIRNRFPLILLLGILFSGVPCRAVGGPSGGTAPQVELEAVKVEPPGGEAELLVHRHLPLRVGQMVDPEALVQAREYLLSTGLFSEVDLYTTRGTRPGAVNAVVAAQPSRRFHLETGLGYKPLGGWFLNIIGVRRTGLFHRGGTARLSFRTGLHASGLYGELELPGIPATDLDLLLNLDVFSETWTAYKGDKPYYQDIHRARALLGVRRQIRPDLQATIWAGVCGTAPTDSLESWDDSPAIFAGALVPVYDHDIDFVNLRAELFRNRLDPLRPWQKGSWSGFALTAAEPTRGPAFWSGEAEARLAVPVWTTRAAAFRLRGIYSDPGTPYFLRPIVGGIGSLRGFPSAGLSGSRGARALWLASAEWRHPLAGRDPLRPRVTGTLFADVGDHWTAEGKRFGISSSIGYGALFRVRWLETVNVEIAYPLTDDPTDSPVTLHVSLGRSF